MKKKLRVLLSILGVSTLAIFGAGCSMSNKLQTGVDQLFCKHEYSEFVVTKDPTCTEKGEKTRTCSKCAKEDKESVEKAEHSLKTVPAIEATCTTSGVESYKQCEVCEEIILEDGQTMESLVIKPLNHSHTKVIEGKPATCTEKGLTDGVVCLDCSKEIQPQTEIPAWGHSLVKDYQINPTCTETGLTDGTHCSVCDEVITPQEVVPAKGHSPALLQGYSPTCLKEGLTVGSYCTTCGDTLIAQEIISPSTEHIYVDGTCSVCGHSESMVALASANTYNVNGNDVLLSDRQNVLGDCLKIPMDWTYTFNIAIETPQNEIFNITLSFRNGRFMNGNTVLRSNIKQAVVDDYVYVKFPTDLFIEGYEQCKILTCGFNWSNGPVENEQIIFPQWIYEPFVATMYEAGYDNELILQDNGLYTYKFASRGDYVMGAPVILLKGDSLVCDFTFSADEISDSGWFGIVFGDGENLERYPHTLYTMRCYSDYNTTLMLGDKVISNDSSKNIFDVFQDSVSYRVSLTRNEDDTYNYKLYRFENGRTSPVLVDECLNIDCPEPTSFMLVTHSSSQAGLKNNFILKDLAFYKTNR